MPGVNRVPLDVSIHWRFLHQDLGLTWDKIRCKQRSYRNFSKATICRHMNKKIGDNIIDKRKMNKGRPQKLSARDHRNVLRQVEILRSKGEYNFTVKRIKFMAGLGSTVCDETVRLILISNGLSKRQTAKKGVLTKSDLVKRLEFAKKVKRMFGSESMKLWTEGIGFYLDGASFTHKYHPLDQAQAPKTRIWRKENERLKFGLTAKSNHEGVGGRQAHFMVGIGYGRGVVICEQYLGRLNGEKFADFIRTHLPKGFADSPNPRGKMFLQDGDPSQNSQKARDAMYSIGARKFSIPPRSPDLNPIENMFHIVKNQLTRDAISKNIKFENWDSFCSRVKTTIMNFPITIINNTIESMEKRIDLIIKSKGERTKY